jgi:hypothetical protein
MRVFTSPANLSFDASSPSLEQFDAAKIDGNKSRMRSITFLALVLQ